MTNSAILLPKNRVSKTAYVVYASLHDFANSVDSEYTGVASGEAKIRSASWEKVDIPGLVTIGFTHKWWDT